MVKEGTLTRPVRYQKGCLYQDNGAWFVRYRESVRQKDGWRSFAGGPNVWAVWILFQLPLISRRFVSASCKESITIDVTLIRA